MACYCNDGWVYEAHPEQPGDHDPDCAVNVPCTNPRCSHGRRWLERQAVDERIDRERYPELSAASVIAPLTPYWSVPQDSPRRGLRIDPTGPTYRGLRPNADTLAEAGARGPIGA
jgi:hypothetical protein